MSILNPNTITALDLCLEAMKDAGALGDGQTASSGQLASVQARLQWMVQEWQRKSLLVYHLVTGGVTCTGAQSYTLGPGGAIDTNVNWSQFTDQFSSSFGSAYPVSTRPSKIESAFVRQLVNSQPNQIDYPLRLLQTMNDYNRIALKSLSSFPEFLFYDPAWPLGNLWPWPVPQASIYAMFVTFLDQLPPMFWYSSMVVNLPYEYFNAIVTNLAVRIRPMFGLNTFPGDTLPGMAKDALALLRQANTRITSLQMPTDLLAGAQYNIFSDQIY